MLRAIGNVRSLVVVAAGLSAIVGASFTRELAPLGGSAAVEGRSVGASVLCL